MPIEPISSRILIFVIAYHAEGQIKSVLDRLPESVRNCSRYHILCIDDASDDSSAATAAEWAKENLIVNITILRNSVNQGYGGNQKLGFRFACKNPYDLVIMVHGDGQYAPELIPDLVELWEKTDADIVLGSSKSSILSSGLPKLGSHLLNKFQNFVTGQKLSEFHKGYRAYSTRLLRSIPYEINTNLSHFDTEIVLQALYAGGKFAELPVPKSYDKSCGISSLRYAWDVVLATLQYRSHSLGMFCSLKYHNIKPVMYDNKTDQRYSSHAKAIALVKKYAPARVLDIGCGPGFIAEKCTQLGSIVTGLDAAQPIKHSTMQQFYQVDLDSEELPVTAFSHDMVLMLDIIEHLARPEDFLVSLRNQPGAEFNEKKPPRLVLSTPNVAFISMRVNLALGRFNYAERGILDITHKRLFTKSSLKRLLEDCGYYIDEWIAIGPPFELVLEGKIGLCLSTFFDFLARLWPSIFAFQFLVVARPKPGIELLLTKSERIAVLSK